MAKGDKKSIKRGIEKRAVKSPWERQSGWRSVNPGTESNSLLFGNEGGFLSLEEFDGDVSGFDANAGSVEEEHIHSLTVPEVDSKVDKKSKKRKKSGGAKGQVAVKVCDSLAINQGDILQEKRWEDQKSKKKRKSKMEKDQSAVGADYESLYGTVTYDIEGDSTVDGVTNEEQTAGGTPKKERKARTGSKTRRAKKRDREISSQAAKAAADFSGKEGAMEARDLEDSVSMEKGLSEPAEGTLEAGKKEKIRRKGTADKELGIQEHSDEEFDITAWAEMRLHPLLEKALRHLRFCEPTPIQRECIPSAAHKGKDVIGAAETGSGKTLAFGLPILQRLLEEKEKVAYSLGMCSEETEAGSKNDRSGPLRALIISPTRELALQICDHLKAAAKWTTIKVVPIVGGMAALKQQRLLSYKPEIIVGTPGRLWELMSNGETHLLELHSLSFFVLDEADRMVEKGHFKELQSIIDALPSNRKRSAEEEEYSNIEGVNDGDGVAVDLPRMRKRRQTLVFSATLALPPNFKHKLKMSTQGPKPFIKSLDSVAALSERAGVSHKAAIVDLTSSTIVAKSLTECALECRDEDKDIYLYYLLKIHGGGRTIVFCTSISALRRVSAILQILQLPIHSLHAQMQQKQRLKAMDRFRSSHDGVLVATDVAARGLDVPGVRTVVHYQLPHSAEIYVHRSGRTARASTDGCSIALVSPADRAKYVTLCKALSRPDGFNSFPINMAYIPACKTRVDLAIKVDKLKRRNAQSKAAHAWLARSAQEMELDIEESEDEDEPSGKRSALSKGESAQLRASQKELDEMLNQPVKPKAFSNRYITGGGMTPLVTKQLQEYARAMSMSGPRGKDAARKSASKSKLVVIGQERIDPLEVVRLTSAQATTSRPSRPGKRKRA